MDQKRNSLVHRPQKSLRDVSEESTIPSRMASRRAMVSGLSYWVLRVNQWIICSTRGWNNCSATYTEMNTYTWPI